MVAKIHMSHECVRERAREMALQSHEQVARQRVAHGASCSLQYTAAHGLGGGGSHTLPAPEAGQNKICQNVAKNQLQTSRRSKRQGRSHSLVQARTSSGLAWRCRRFAEVARVTRIHSHTHTHTHMHTHTYTHARQNKSLRTASCKTQYKQSSLAHKQAAAAVQQQQPAPALHRASLCRLHLAAKQPDRLPTA